MIRMRMIAMLSALVCGFALEVCGQDMHKDVLIYPVFDDGFGTTLYDADYYSNADCTMGQMQEYVWAPTGCSTPESCAQAVPRYSLCQVDPIAVGKGAVALDAGPGGAIDQPLKLVLRQTCSFGESLNTYTYNDKLTPPTIVPRVDPQRGITTQQDPTYAKITTAHLGRTIPVKIFHVKLSTAVIGVPANAANVVRPDRVIAFEIDAWPASVPVPATITATQKNSKKFSGTFVDSLGRTVFVVTKSQLFP